MRDTCGQALSTRSLRTPFISRLPLIGTLEARVLVMPATFVAIATCALVVVLLYRQITVIGRLAELLWVGVALASAG